MEKMRRILAVLMIGATLFGLTACGGSKQEEAPKTEAPAQEQSQEAASTTPQVTVQIAYENFPGEPTDLAANEWARLIEERSGGTMKAEIFHSGQLGSKTDLLDQMQMGEAVITLGDGSFWGDYGAPELAITSAPYIYDSWDQAWKLVESDSGVTRRIMALCDILTGRLWGGLAQVNVLLSTLMGGLSGSSLADAAMEARMLVPEMEKKGMSKAFSSVVTAASAMITPIIPPGIAMILCGSLANVSIGKLFVSGIGVGVLLCAGEMITVSVISKKRGYAPSREGKLDWKEAAPIIKEAILPMCLPVIIIGGVRLGVFTATETGAVAVVYSIMLGLLYHELDWETIKNGLRETVLSTAGIMLIIGAASALSWILTKEQIPQMLAAGMMAVSGNKYVFLLLVNVFLLFVGMFIEGNAAMIILVPLLFPIAMNYGINEVQFLMVFIFNMAIGSMSPPMGTLMFVVCGETKCKLKDFIVESIPFYIVLILELLALTFIPFLTTGLVNLIY